MFAVQNLARKAPQLSKPFFNQHRTILSTPPRAKVSSAELIGLGIALWVGIMVVPIYISCNVTKYAASKK
ncbi:uncharacterized protein LOC116429740 [Nomia melanderi]|uniref:uncharacterized protein LOC116429740 n=1 Tax=Nomia melanderi TaxID=2448451 RepID=UPI003FCD2D63